jgi:AcrR family transcriptional regulator
VRVPMARDETRERILEHGARLIRRDGVAAVRIADVAEGAGVSRQSVYLHFTNRAGLLTEIARHIDLTSPQARLIREAMTIEPVDAALTTFVRAFFGYLPTALPVVSALEAAAVTDEAARIAWTSRKQTVHDMLGVIIRRLHDAGRLKPTWSIARATDWAFLSIHPALWTELVEERGWSARSYTEQAIEQLQSALCRPVR